MCAHILLPEKILRVARMCVCTHQLLPETNLEPGTSNLVVCTNAIEYSTLAVYGRCEIWCAIACTKLKDKEDLPEICNHLLFIQLQIAIWEIWNRAYCAIQFSCNFPFPPPCRRYHVIWVFGHPTGKKLVGRAPAARASCEPSHNPHAHRQLRVTSYGHQRPERAALAKSQLP